MLYSNKKKQKLFYFGHRGAPELIRENTLKSIEMAINLGCDGVEIDIQMTSDNRVILFHDLYINNNNQKHKISNCTHDQINIFLGKQGIPPAPLFDDFISLIKNHPHIIFNIEIKSQQLINYTIINELYCKISINPELLKRCIISSFNFLVIFQCKLLFDRNMLGLIICSNRARGTLNNIINKLLVTLLNPRFVHLSKAFLNHNIINWARNRGMLINVYTINTKEHLEQCLDNQIDGIFTDNHLFYSALD